MESLIYGNGYIVPSALRGLHAWIATLTPSLTHKFVERDSYGVFRYGDPASLSIHDSKGLLKSLEETAANDPYFRSEDWHATFARGLAKPELKEDIIRIIRNPDSSYQLSHLLIESTQGDKFVREIEDDLLAIAIDSSAIPIERYASIEALLESDAELPWTKIVDQLTQENDTASFKVIGRIIKNETSLFNGEKLANILKQSSKPEHSKDSLSYYEFSYGLEKKMSLQQLDDSLHVLLTSKEDSNDPNVKRYRNIEEWIYKFAEERLKRSDPPEAKIILSWLQYGDDIGSPTDNYHKSSWNEFSKEYFSTNESLRREIQKEALKLISSEQGYWSIFMRYGLNYSGLWLREEDVIHHLIFLSENNASYSDWLLCWKALVVLAKNSSDFIGSAYAYARQQSEQNEQLKEILYEIEHPPTDNFEIEQAALEKKNQKERARRTREIQESYTKVIKDIASGKNLHALRNVANVYLGRYSNLYKDTTPEDRVTELIGRNNVNTAFEGLKIAVEKGDVPSARELTTLRAKENKTYHLECILLAYCDIQIKSGKNLLELSPNLLHSSLASCHWDTHYGDSLTSDLRDQLEKIIFTNKKSKEDFVRDTMEPYLESEASHVAGLYRFARYEEFSDIAGAISMEWLKKYGNLPHESESHILAAAIHYNANTDLIELIRKRIRNKIWNNSEQEGIWMGAAFLLDIEYHQNELNEYVKRDKKHLWPLRSIAFNRGGNQENESSICWPKLNAQHNHFLINSFGSHWPPTDFPSEAWCGDENDWDACKFIEGRISDLASDLSDEAASFLKKFIGNKDLDGYQDYIKHAYAQQTRQRAEANKKLLHIEQVQNLLIHGEPSTHDDMQAIILDELDSLQDRIRNSPRNEIAPFWNNDLPQEENYCRDLIASALIPYLERYGIRIDTEAAMPNNNRCDLLNTHGVMNLPIEIKGQWHPKIWSAATEQLQNYTREYRSKGRGIYLILWFGYLGTKKLKNPRGWKSQPLPKTVEKMKKLLIQKYSDISEKTRIFVLDLSTTSNHPVVPPK